MKYQPPYDPALAGVRQPNGTFNADADAPYVNGNPATATEGSIPPDDAFEHPQREIVAAIVAAGLTPDHNVLTQLRQAIARSASGSSWFACSGAGGAYTMLATAAFDVPTSPFSGQIVRFRPNHTNPGAASATFAGVTKAVRTAGDQALVGGELSPTRVAEGWYDATANAGAGALLLLPWVTTGVTATADTNLLDNPEGSVNQRGYAGGALASGSFGYDRWKSGANGTTMTVASGVWTLSGTMRQVLEAPDVANRTVTVSVTQPPSAELSISFAGATATLAAGATSVALSIGAVSGNQTLDIVAAASTTFGTPKLEIGALATPYHRRHPQTELDRCLCYYQPLSAWSGAWVPAFPTLLYIAGDFPVRMRATPSLVMTAAAGLYAVKLGYSAFDMTGVWDSAVTSRGGWVALATANAGGGTHPGTLGSVGGVWPIWASADI